MKWTSMIGKTDYIDFDWSLAAAYHLSKTEIVLIDSGPAPSPEFLVELEQRGIRVRAILCSHPHPDHIANNPILYDRFGCEIFMPEEGLANMEEGGWPLYPMTPDLTEPPPLIPVTKEATWLDVDGARFQLITTPGHMPGHTAIVTPDGVCFLGDAMVSPEVLSQFKMPYMTDVDLSLESMEKIRQTQFPFYITAHKGVTPLSGLQELVNANVGKELDIYDILRRQIDRPIPVDELLTRFLNALNISERNQRSSWMQQTSMDRVNGLIHAGEIALRDGIVYPV